MLYNPPSGSTDPNAPYLGKNTAAGVQGSRVPRLAIEATQREIVNAIAMSGLVPTNGDLTQLWQAIQRAVAAGMPTLPSLPPSAYWHLGTAGGSPTALVVDQVTPAISGEAIYPCLIRVPQGVNANASLSIAGIIGPLQRNDGTPVQARDAPPDSDILVVRRPGAWRLVPPGYAEVVRIVIAPKVWVRTDGSDDNDGSQNAPGSSFKSLAAALNFGVSRFGLTATSLTVQMGVAGTYDAPGTIYGGGGRVLILGDPNSPGAFVVSGTGVAGGAPIITTAGRVDLSGFTLRQTGTNGHTLAATQNAITILDHVNLVADQANTGYAHVFGTSGASVTVAAACSVQGSTGMLFNADGGLVSLNPTSLSLLGTPNFAVAAAVASNGGRVKAQPGASFSGAATGKKFATTLNGIVDASGQGDIFPGNSAGTNLTGGQYAP